MNPEIWRMMCDAIDDPIFLHDAQYRVLLGNRAYFLAAGMAEADAIGKPYWEVFPRGSGPLPGCKDALDCGHVGNRDEVSVGEKLFISTGYAVRDAQGTLLYSLHILSDITAQRQTEESLKNMAAKFHAVYESSSDAIMLLNEKGFFDCNAATLRIFGCSTRDEFTNKHPAQLSPPTQPGGEDSMSLANQHIATAFKNGSNHFEWMHRRIDGADFPADVLLTAMELEGKQVLQATVRDISERKQAEEKNLRLSRMYRTISLCNEALVRSSDELELAHEMCRVLVEYGGYRLARVSYAGGDPEKSLVRVAWAGAGEDFCPADARLTWADTGGCQVPVARTLRSGTPQICHDIASDPGFAPWRDAALACGYASNIGLPLFDGDGRILGGLSIYSAEPHVFNEDETLLLAELAGDLAFGIVNIRARAERMGILEKLELSLDHAVTAIAATVEMRDPYTAGHQRRVAKLAAAIAKEMGLPEQQVEGLRMAGVVHDIGKIHVPAEILSNPSKLTAAEFEIIKTHPQAGYDILKGIDFPWPVAEIVYQHHEKLDGSGYPRGLKGEEILLEARILTVADVVEAMASHRPYRPGFGIFPALQEIARNKGKFYDECAAGACLRLFMEKNYEL